VDGKGELCSVEFLRNQKHLRISIFSAVVCIFGGTADPSRKVKSKDGYGCWRRQEYVSRLLGKFEGILMSDR
jgi:hypothetical protein